MFWLTNISVYICEVNKMCRELEEFLPGLISANEKERAMLIMQRIDVTLISFRNTETRIIHTIKKNENYPDNVYVLLRETKFAVNNEEYLFKVIQYHDAQLLELQTIVNQYLEESAEQKHISKIIELPRSITIKNVRKQFKLRSLV